jgi:hypothetical protein
LISSSVQKKLEKSCTHSKYAHGDAAGVGEHVGHHQDAALVQDVVRGRGGRAVGALDDDARARVAGALDGELAFERGGDEELALEAPELLGVDRRGAGEALQAAVRGGVLRARRGCRCRPRSPGWRCGRRSRSRARRRRGTCARRCRRRCRSPARPRARPRSAGQMRRAASRAAMNTPRPVASWRPRLPPSAIGLPVTTPVAVPPRFIE